MTNFSVLILLLGLLCNANLTAFSTSHPPAAADTLTPVASRPSVLTLSEAGARLALRSRADLELTQHELHSANGLIGTQQATIAGLNGVVISSRQISQQQSDQLAGLRRDIQETRLKLRLSRRENWAWRGIAAVGLYLLMKPIFR